MQPETLYDPALVRAWAVELLMDGRDYDLGNLIGEAHAIAEYVMHGVDAFVGEKL